jgi:hypothetical protein
MGLIGFVAPSLSRRESFLSWERRRLAGELLACLDQTKEKEEEDEDDSRTPHPGVSNTL